MHATSRLKDTPGLEYLQELSCGSFGALWLARRLAGSEVGRLVVARRLESNHFDAPNVDCVLAAAQRYSSLSHPWLVKNLGGERTESDVVLLEEHLIGVPLGKLHQLALASQTSLPTGVGVKLILDALRAADALRRTCLNQGLALPGRTIFPDSVMVANFGEALLSGVGVTEELCRCRRIREHPDLVDVLDPSAADADSTDERIEVFTAGALLWKLLLIRGLFNDYDNQKTLSLVLHSNVLLAEFDERLNLCVPKPVANVIRRATQPKLGLRYASLQEMILAIEALPPPLVASDSQVRVWLEGIAGDYLSDVQHSSGVRPIPSSLQTHRLPAGTARRPSVFPTLSGFQPLVEPGVAPLQPVASAGESESLAVAPRTSHPVNPSEGRTRRTSGRPDRKAYVVGALLGIVASLGLTYLVGWMNARPTTPGRNVPEAALQGPIEPQSTDRQVLSPAAPAPTRDVAGPAQGSTVTQGGPKHVKSQAASASKREPKPLATTSANRWGI